jgi:hypothetical protein
VGSQQITEPTYQHWIAVAQTEEGPKSKHRTAHAREQLVTVMDFLISADWIRGEASELGVAVSPAMIRRKFDHLRHEVFAKGRQYRAFLRRNKETVADLLGRVELQLLAAQIQKRALAGVHSKAARAKALAHFLSEFQVKWKNQTYCLPAYSVPDCGHVQAAL